MEQQLNRDERVAIARLYALLELLPTELDKRMAPAGLTSFEYTLLEALADTEGQWMRLSALAARTNATLPRLSRVVSGLERKQLVERVPCAEDKRATNAVLTARGARTVEDARPRYASAVRDLVLSGLDVERLSDLAVISYAILARLDPDARLSVTVDGSSDAACSADPESVE